MEQALTYDEVYENYSEKVMHYILSSVLPKRIGGSVSSDEIGLPVTESGLILPSGATAVWSAFF